MIMHTHASALRPYLPNAVLALLVFLLHSMAYTPAQEDDRIGTNLYFLREPRAVRCIVLFPYPVLLWDTPQGGWQQERFAVFLKQHSKTIVPHIARYGSSTQ